MFGLSESTVYYMCQHPVDMRKGINGLYKLVRSEMKGRILYENIPSGYDYLTDLIEAMRENKIIQITYCGFWSGKKATFELKPYCLKVFKQRWYIIAGNVSY